MSGLRTHHNSRLEVAELLFRIHHLNHNRLLGLHDGNPREGRFLRLKLPSAGAYEHDESKLDKLKGIISTNAWTWTGPKWQEVRDVGCLSDGIPPFRNEIGDIVHVAVLVHALDAVCYRPVFRYPILLKQSSELIRTQIIPVMTIQKHEAHTEIWRNIM